MRTLDSEEKGWEAGSGPRLKQELGGELFTGAGPSLKEHESVVVMTRVWLSDCSLMGAISSSDNKGHIPTVLREEGTPHCLR